MITKASIGNYIAKECIFAVKYLCIICSISKSNLILYIEFSRAKLITIKKNCAYIAYVIPLSGL